MGLGSHPALLVFRDCSGSVPGLFLEYNEEICHGCVAWSFIGRVGEKHPSEHAHGVFRAAVLPRTVPGLFRSVPGLYLKPQNVNIVMSI